MVANQNDWVEFGGNAENFFKFEKDGDEIAGSWVGSKPGKYENRVGVIRNHDGEISFSLSKALEDLEQFPEGTSLKIVFAGWRESKSGTRFKAFRVYTRGAVELEPEPTSEDPAPFQATDEDVPF